MTIAFCFLTYDVIVRYDIWNLFFKDIDVEKYRVFIHPKSNFLHEKYTFPYQIVKNRIITNRKDNINIVRATLRLLKETYIYDNSKK